MVLRNFPSLHIFVSTKSLWIFLWTTRKVTYGFSLESIEQYSSFFTGDHGPCCWCSITKSCPTLCDPLDCNMPDFPVLPYLLEFAQTHVPGVSDAIQPSHPLSSPSPPAFNLSQHHSLFLWAGSSHQVAKVLELQHAVFGTWKDIFYIMTLDTHTHPSIMYTFHVTILFLPSLASDQFCSIALKNTSHNLLTWFHNPLIYHGLQLENTMVEILQLDSLLQREDSTVEPRGLYTRAGREGFREGKEGSVPAAGVFHSGWKCSQQVMPLSFPLQLDHILSPPPMPFRKCSNPDVASGPGKSLKFKRQLSEDGRQLRRGSLGGALTGELCEWPA